VRAQAVAETQARGASLTAAQLRQRCVERANALRHANKIYVEGSDCPAPLTAFADLAEAPFAVPAFLVRNIGSCRYDEPTPIQMQSIPIMLARRDMIACAPTGSGKTAAYLIPIFATLKAPGASGFRAVVWAPTRELSAQFARVAARLAAGRPFRIQHLTKANAQQAGGGGHDGESGGNSGKHDVLITTPMRLVHLVRAGSVDLAHVELLILDEADRLLELDSGFAEQVDEVFAACAHPRLVRALFSATMLPGIEELARSVLRDPLRVTIGVRNSATENIAQRLLFAGDEAGKLLAVRQLVREGIKPPVLIFVQSIERARHLFHELVYDGINVDVIHAERTQAQRDSIIQNFRLGKIWMLICTDLMARGIDFKGVHCVLNYDFPQSVVSYIHRIGRTGRAGRKGEAITLYTEEDSDYLRSIANVMKLSGCEVPDWMLQLRKQSRKDKQYLAKHAPSRDSIRTATRIDRVQGARNKKRLLGKVGYQERPKTEKAVSGGGSAAADSGAQDEE
jgi:ATP-dependent RNA helicase DDX52/ROK1